MMKWFEGENFNFIKHLGNAAFPCLTPRKSFITFLLHVKNKILFVLLLLQGLVSFGNAAEPEKSVVHITTFIQQPLWNIPWQFASVQKSTGSGFVVGGKRIMTNAHVVSWAKEILVKRHDDARSYPAHVKFIGHDCDLAILEVDNPNFFDGLEPLSFGDLPLVRSTVITYGYPAGGDQISYTRGVVSRIEMQPYSHIGNQAHLAAQTDAALNPGNSGGPVIQDDKVVGVAFQGSRLLENTGFFIPPPIIEHFLKDIEDGLYHGFPRAGVDLLPLENPSYRHFLSLPDDGMGARVDHIYDIPSTKKVLEIEDVILQVGTYPVKSDGTILYKGNRVSVGVAFQEPQNGESLPIRLWRKGHEINISLPMNVYREDAAEGNQYDVLPRYYVYGGLVFAPLNLNYLSAFNQEKIRFETPELLYELFEHRYEKPADRRQEPIVLVSILSHSVNADLLTSNNALVDKINNIRIERLEDVIRAMESFQGDYHMIQLIKEKQMECLDRKEVERVNGEILKTYHIPQDRRL